jgi:hypothetical protein
MLIAPLDVVLGDVASVLALLEASSSRGSCTSSVAAPDQDRLDP